MKTLLYFEDTLRAFESKFGMRCLGAEQGSAVWHNMRLGVVTASNAHKAVAGLKTATRWTYLYELVAQVGSGVSPEINSRYLDYGREHESAAKALYELHTNKKISEVAFIFKEGFRCGASPDGIIDVQHGLELKVPFAPVNYVEFLCDNNIDPEYQWQCQFSMWVAGAESWDFAMFSPVMKVKPIHIFPVKRDPEMQKKLDDLIPGFISDLDAELKKIGLTFGDQWRRLA